MMATEKTKVNLEKVQALKTKMNTLLSNFSNQERLFTQEASLYRTDKVTGANYFVNDLEAPQDSNTYNGCYFNKMEGKPESEGRIFTEAMCRQRAIDQGKSVYALEGVGEDGLANCQLGDKVDEATKGGEVGKQAMPLGDWQKTAIDGGKGKQTSVKNGIFKTELKRNLTAKQIEEAQLADPKCFARMMEVLEEMGEDPKKAAFYEKHGVDASGSFPSILSYLMRVEKTCPNPEFQTTSIAYDGAAYYVNQDGELAKSGKSAACVRRGDKNQMYGPDGIVAVYTQKPVSDSRLGHTFYIESKNSNEMSQYPKSMLTGGTEFASIAGFDSPGNNIRLGKYTDKTADQCKQLCVETGEDCAGFVFQEASKTCFLKDKIYPEVARIQNQQTAAQGSTIYSRIPMIKGGSNSCPQNVIPVPTLIANSIGKISPESMTPKTKCLIGKALEESDAAKSVSSEEILDAGNKILTELRDIVSSKEKMAELDSQTQMEMKGDLQMYEKVFDEIKNMKNTIATEQQRSLDFGGVGKNSIGDWMSPLLILAILVGLGIIVYRRTRT
jgi:hypothetical protein